jgi:hypothetical protein
MNDNAASEYAIVLVAQRWGLARDTGAWDALSSCYHPGALMSVTWYQGTCEGFIAASRANYERGSRSQHFLGGTLARIVDDRAIVQTRVAIMLRGLIDGVAVDVSTLGRFYDRFERRAGDWRITERHCVYDKDRLNPVEPGAQLKLDPAILARFPEGYQYLAYLLVAAGRQVADDLPTLHSGALDRLLQSGERWLAET